MFKESLAEVSSLTDFQILQILTDRSAGLCGGNEVHPGRVWLRPLCGNDLDGLPVLELGAQRNQAAIDLCCDAPIAHVGMHRVGEVDGSGTAWQALDVTIGCKYVHLVGKEIDFDGFQKLLGIR